MIPIKNYDNTPNWFWWKTWRWFITSKRIEPLNFCFICLFALYWIRYAKISTERFYEEETFLKTNQKQVPREKVCRLFVVHLLDAWWYLSLRLLWLSSLQITKMCRSYCIQKWMANSAIIDHSESVHRIPYSRFMQKAVFWLTPNNLLKIQRQQFECSSFFSVCGCNGSLHSWTLNTLYSGRIRTHTPKPKLKNKQKNYI